MFTIIKGLSLENQILLDQHGHDLTKELKGKKKFRN